MICLVGPLLEDKFQVEIKAMCVINWVSLGEPIAGMSKLQAANSKISIRPTEAQL